MALADVYDALISRRVYKPAFPHEQAVRMIEAGSGSHFDPDVVAAFSQVQGHSRPLHWSLPIGRAGPARRKIRPYLVSLMTNRFF